MRNVLSDKFVGFRVMPPVLFRNKEITQHGLENLQTDPQPSGNPVGFQWDWLLRVVVHVEQAPIAQVFLVR